MRFNFFKKNWQVKPFVLISLDGWGIAPPSKGNAITLAKTPHYDSYLKLFPHTQLIASGEAVGLPANEVGNSEVGHLTMGVGRVVFQSLERINMSIRDESFYQTPAFLQAIGYAKTHNSTLHLIGMVGSGNVHSSTKHLYALLETCKRQRFASVALHLITDGRDSPPQEATEIVAKIEEDCRVMGVGKVATVSGRYYAMDRDARWERIKIAYDAIIMSQGEQYTTAEDAVKQIYQSGKSDEFVLPAVIVKPGETPITINDNDAVIYFNFRVDRARELTMAITLPDFENMQAGAFGFGGGAATFRREKKVNNVFFVTMTEYQEGLPVSAIAYPPEKQLGSSVGEIISKAGWWQIRIAESEKERMVTYYYNGMRSEPFENQEVAIVPSPKVATYDLMPEMSATGVVKLFKTALKKDLYQTVMMNFANPDMVAHTGNLEAAIKAVEVTDWAMNEIVQTTLEHDGMVFITADHGNAEELITFPTNAFFYTTAEGTINTDHSNNPIPFIVIANRLKGNGNELPPGVMRDIAPTMLKAMGLPVPEEMKGTNLMEGII
jgi:2,3-bisphosphoglycerate-independent phosphoglycerate mutase